MAQKSEQIQSLLDEVENMLTAYYAEAAFDRIKDTQSQPSDVRVKTAGEVAKAGRQLKLFRGRGANVLKTIDGLRRPKANADTDHLETAMNDGAAEWTPERIAALHTKVRERMEKFVESLEFKRMAARDAAGGRGGEPSSTPHPGGSPGPSA